MSAEETGIELGGDVAVVNEVAIAVEGEQDDAVAATAPATEVDADERDGDNDATATTGTEDAATPVGVGAGAGAGEGGAGDADGVGDSISDRVGAAAKSSSTSPWVNVSIVFLSVAIDILGLSIILPTLPFLGLKYNANSFEVGIIFAAYALAQFLSVPITGRLSDKFGRRPLVLLSIVGSCVGFLFQAFSNSYAMFLAARFAAGAFGASVPIAMAYVADVTTQKERPRYLAILGSVIGACFLFGPSVGSGLTQLGDLNTPMFVASGLAAAAFVLAFFKLKESPKRSREESRARGSGSLDMNDSERSESKLYLIALYLGELFNMAAFTSILSMTGLYTAELYDFTALHLGFVFTSISVVYIVTQLTLFNALVAKIGKHGTGVVGCITFAVGQALVPLFDGIFPVFVVAMLVGACGYGLATPSLPSLISRYAPPEAQGKALGAGQAMQALARVITPAVFGALYDVHRTIPYWAAAVLCLINAVLLFSVLRRNRRLGLDKRLREQQDAATAAFLPRVRNEAAKVKPNLVKLLGTVVAELLISGGRTAEELNDEAKLAEIIKQLHSTLGDSDDVAKALGVLPTTGNATA